MKNHLPRLLSKQKTFLRNLIPSFYTEFENTIYFSNMLNIFQRSIKILNKFFVTNPNPIPQHEKKNHNFRVKINLRDEKKN